MTVAEREYPVTDDALDLLSCFYNGVDKIVYRIAAVAAKERLQLSMTSKVVIEREDVEKAGEIILGHLSDLDDNKDFEMLLRGSKSCFEEKTRKTS